MNFNPHEHLRKIKSSQGEQEYLDVKWRLVWFRELCPLGTIDTEEITVDLDREMEAEQFVWNAEKRRSEKVVRRANGYARFKATVTDGKGGRATGHKSECAASFGDYIEKAETGAIGRALAALGYGTQFVGDDLDEEHRMVDAPVDRQQRTASNGSTSSGNAQLDSAPSTKQQLESIEKLCQHLGKEAPTPPTYKEAKEIIGQLSQEYKQSRQTSGK